MSRLRSSCIFLLLSLAPMAVAADAPFQLREAAVLPSPAQAQQLVLPAGQKVVDFDVWSTGAEAAILVRDTDGRFCVLSWTIGAHAATPQLTLPAGLEARAIAAHPARRTLFLSGRQGGQSVILAARQEGNTWSTQAIFTTDRELRRLMVAPRPFEIGHDPKRQQAVNAYRLVFGARLAGGAYSIRSITEDGKREYQVIGPRSGYAKVPGADAQPAEIFADSALPATFHPEGNILLWQDGRNCYQQLPYSAWEWGKPAPLPNVPCGGSVTVTPNGIGLLHWQSGQPGIAVVLDHGRTQSRQATQYTFTATPSSVPDGKGVVGLIEERGGSRLVYAPLNVPMADVVNAWMFLENPADRDLFTTKGGLFRQLKDDQLYQLYDSENYACGGWDRTTPTRPYLVTTDILWEIVAAAYEGTFIVQERQQAIPAFWTFVDAARVALSAKSGSPWAAAFEALAALHANKQTSNAEAQRISQASGRFQSAVFGKEFDYAELKPRGHYTSTPEMAAYFKAVHFLTELAQTPGRDPGELASLPADVKNKAMSWIAVYQPYIAPSRAQLVWSAQPASIPKYVRHPARNAMVFPLAFGFDNEVLLSTVYHPDWPQAEQITGAQGPRLVPSGLDLAAALGSGFAHLLLKGEFDKYPTLGAALAALAARSNAAAPANLYDRWISALAVQWADDVAFPGASDNTMWKAKRLQTGLASWATLRHATLLVNERTQAECGEGGFETIILRSPRGYVEPDPKAFAAIASLFDEIAQTVSTSKDFGGGKMPDGGAASLQQGILRRLRESAEKARLFQRIAEKELRGQELTDKEYEEILYVGRVAEHQFLVFKSLASKDFALSNPDPVMKVADVSGGAGMPILEAAVGRPLEWDHVVPFFGRRQIVKGSVYSYHEFTAPAPLADAEWRKRADREAHPGWIAPLMSTKGLSCPAKAPF